MLLQEYRKTLKVTEGEEIFDLIFFRPLGYMVVKVLYRTRITPNHVTTLSLVAGLASAWPFSQGTAPSLMWGAVLYALANVLDCADGQLARLQESGTMFGRVWDGVADYVSTIAVFLGIGFGFPNVGWALVIAAGVSTAFHSMVFDYYQSAFMAARNGNGNFLQSEVEKYQEEIHLMNQEGHDSLKSSFLRMYIVYLRLQALFGSGLSQRVEERMIRLWSFLGPTTNRTALIISVLFGRMDFYLWIVVTAGNIWLLVCFIIHRRYVRP